MVKLQVQLAPSHTVTQKLQLAVCGTFCRATAVVQPHFRIYIMMVKPLLYRTKLCYCGCRGCLKDM